MSTDELGTCAVTDCFTTADGIAAATVGMPPDVGAVEDDLVLDVPLCGEHLHLLRMGVTSFALDTRE